MKGSFTKRGRQCDVIVTRNQLKCTLKNNLGPNVLLEINLSDILAIQAQTRDNSEVNSVTVHYASSKRDNTLSWDKLVLSGDAELCKELNNIFAQTLPERQKHRNYLVMINPHSGKKNASRIFHKKVAPLFKACGINYKIYVTTAKKDTMNALKDVDFSTLDGVISCGGDGFYLEVVTALVLKQQQEYGINVDDADVDLAPIPFPIGIIPAGSGNYIARYIHGTTDVVTAAIKIVLAKSTPQNLSSVHQGGKLESYAGLLSSFGLIGDMMEKCEKFRWMGNMRYKVIPIRCILSRRLFDAEVEFLRESTGEWDSVKGPFYNIDSGVVNLADMGSKLVPVFGDGALSLHMSRACPLGLHIKQLSKLADEVSGAWDFDFVQTERVTRYRVKMQTPARQSADGEMTLEDSYYMNLDGEVLLINRQKFDVRLHCGVVRLFGEKSY